MDWEQLRGRPRIGVLGPNQCDETQRALGLAVGHALARRGAILFCGGLGGMMAAAAEGAKQAGGLTVGVLPGTDAGEANPFIDLPLPTGLDAYRNMLLVRFCHAVIAVCGQYGTLSEVAFALRLGIPVVGLHTWQLQREGRLDPGIMPAGTPEEAVENALSAVAR